MPDSDDPLPIRIRRLAERVDAIDHRVRDLQEWTKVTERETAHLDRRFQLIEGRLDKIDTVLSRLVWLILAGIVSGAMTFVMSGGLQLVAA